MHAIRLVQLTCVVIADILVYADLNCIINVTSNLARALVINLSEIGICSTFLAITLHNNGNTQYIHPYFAVCILMCY